MLLFTLQWRQESGDLTRSLRVHSLCSMFHKAADCFNTIFGRKHLSHPVIHPPSQFASGWSQVEQENAALNPVLVLNLDETSTGVAWFVFEGVGDDCRVKLQLISSVVRQVLSGMSRCACMRV